MPLSNCQHQPDGATTPTPIATTRKVDLAIRTARIEARDSFSVSFLCFNFQEPGVASNDLPSVDIFGDLSLAFIACRDYSLPA